MATTIVSSGVANNIDENYDIKVVEVKWWRLILIRTARSYIQSLLGLLGARELGLTGIHEISFIFVTAAFPAFISLLQNSLEILTKLDSSDSYAKYRG